MLIFFCISDATRVTNDYGLVIKRKEGVDGLVFDSVGRKNRQEEIYKKYMTSYGNMEGYHCDIGLASLSN